MRESGTEVYSGSASLTEIGLCIAVPPLLLLVAWLFRLPGAAPFAGAAARPELNAAPPGIGEYGGTPQNDRTVVPGREQDPR